MGGCVPDPAAAQPTTGADERGETTNHIGGIWVTLVHIAGYAVYRQAYSTHFSGASQVLPWSLDI